MSDYSNPLHSNFGKPINPVILANDLKVMGYDIVYLDADRIRLAQAEMLRINTIDMSELYRKGTRHFAIAIVVNPEKFHPVNKIEYKAISSKQMILINV